MCGAGWSALGARSEDVELLALAMSESGARDLSFPLIGAAAANLLLHDSPDADDLLAAVHDGSARIALALGPLDGDRLAGPAQWDGETLQGTLGAVEDMLTASHLLVIPQAGSSLGVIDLSRAGDTIRIEPVRGYAVPPLARITLSRTPAIRIAQDRVSARRVADLARLLLISRARGAADHGLAIVQDYTALREQFGQAIGKFQAIRHKLADCKVRADLVEVLIEDTLRAFAGSGDVEHSVATLVSVAAPALRRNAVETQHVFGAVGYAAEHASARHFVRIHADTSRLGGARRARQIIAQRLQTAAARDSVFPNEDEPKNLRELRTEVRQWLTEHWSPEAQASPARSRECDIVFNKALAAKGWLTAGWPREWGGPGFDAFEQFAFVEEMRSCNAPMTIITPSYWIVAAAIIAMGSQQMKEALLPRLASADMSFALGYSEPQAGSDLAALATRAVRDGNDYVINGQKIWTSNAEFATHILLAARTGGDPVKAKHEGITVFVVPIDAPGITVKLMDTLHEKTFAVIFFDDVRVPADMMVGAEGEGWRVLGAALKTVRIMMGGQIASLRGQFAALVEKLNGRGSTAQDPALWDRLAGLSAELDGARLLARRSVRLVSDGEDTAVAGAIAKLYSGDLAERIGETILDMCGVEAGLSRGAPGALLDGDVSHHLRTSLMLVIGGGTEQIQRNTIAGLGLNLPRSR